MTLPILCRVSKKWLNKSQILFVTLIFMSLVCTAQNQAYKNERHNYSIKYYDGWVIEVEDENYTRINAPGDIPGTTRPENISIAVSDAEGKNLNDLYELYTKDLFISGEFKKLKEGELEINQHKAKWLQCTNKNRSNVFVNYHCFVVSDNKLFMMYGLATNASFPAFEDKFKKIMMSLEVHH